MSREFSYKEPIKYGISAFIDNFKISIYAQLILACIGLLSLIGSLASLGLLGVIYNSLRAHQPYTDAIMQLFSAIHITVPFIFITLVQVVLLFLISAGLLKFYLHIFDNKSPSLSDIFAFDLSSIKYVIAVVLYYLLVFIGLLLFIFPGIYIAMNYYAVPYLVIDKKMDILESFERSSAYTAGLKQKLFWFELLLNAITYFVGFNLLTMVPFALARIFVYRSYLLKNTTSDSHA